MWNDTDVPLAHLITFRCHGTWLHGDSRGSIDRFHNRYMSPYIEPNKNWHRYNTEILEGEPVTLDASRRRSVEAAILETCTDRKWQLHALNVRTNHVHTVVSIGLVKPALALVALKAKSTKRMRLMDVGGESPVRGRQKVANDRCGMSAVWRAPLTTCSMDKAMSYPILMKIEPGRCARGTDLIAAQSLLTRRIPGRCARGTDLIAAQSLLTRRIPGRCASGTDLMVGMTTTQTMPAWRAGSLHDPGRCCRRSHAGESRRHPPRSVVAFPSGPELASDDV